MLFECHITVALEHGQLAAEPIAKALHWKTSEIARDPVLGQASYFYLTSHGTDYIELFTRMEEASAHLEAVGCPVIREKIELIMYDTKGK